MVHLTGKVVGQLPGGAGDGAQIKTAIIFPIPLSIRCCAAIPPSHPISMRLQHSYGLVVRWQIACMLLRCPGTMGGHWCRADMFG